MIGLVAVAMVFLFSWFSWPAATNREMVIQHELEEATTESEIYARNRYYSVEPIPVTLREGKTVTGYDAEKVIAAIQSSRADLLEGIRAPELTPLRDYVELFLQYRRLGLWKG